MSWVTRREIRNRGFFPTKVGLSDEGTMICLMSSGIYIYSIYLNIYIYKTFAHDVGFPNIHPENISISMLEFYPHVHVILKIYSAQVWKRRTV